MRNRKICDELEDNRKLYLARLDDIRISPQISEYIVWELEELKQKNEPDCEKAESLVMAIVAEQQEMLATQQKKQQELQKKADENNSAIMRAEENNRKLELLEKTGKEADELKAEAGQINASIEQLNLAKRAANVNTAYERFNDAGNNL